MTARIATSDGVLARIVDWELLSPAGRRDILQRPVQAVDAELRRQVETIVARVRNGGDRALRELSRELDGAIPDQLQVSETEFQDAEAALPKRALDAMQVAIANVRRFHLAQLPQSIDIDTMPGIRCQRISHPIDSVGLYVPAGTAPLPSAAIMLSVPAAIAGCPRVVLCTPPKANGQADPAVITAARLGGVEKIFKLGGAQAIAAMAYGTESVPKVDRIFGPGNAFVTAAKSLVAADMAGASIDMPAGPSELLVIADESANAGFIASDLLSQAEHGPDSQVLLVTTSPVLAGDVAREIERQIRGLGRAAIAKRALQNSRILLAADLDMAADISNSYAPEHLIVQVVQPRALLPRLRNAGSVFLGPWSPESAGDYCSGPNHVLPTYGKCRSYSGLGVDQFMRHMTIQELSKDGLQSIAAPVIELARLEGLDAHALAVSIRLPANEGVTQ
ncbi:MAG TPA: histidinol dehydrogenase [Woeseiaceae bacterium]|nr:histidinol dehydrogenase [Woeseiaceae bacterium]